MGLPAMIQDWRALFRDDKIFWIVQQLHAYALPESYGDALALQREAQLKALALPDVAVSTAFDGGDPTLAMQGDPGGTVHSLRKEVPARRAAAALAGAYYGMDVSHTNPHYAGA